MREHVRFIVLGIQSLITLLFTVLLVHSLLLAYTHDQVFVSLPHVLISFVHLWVTLLVATLLCLFYRTNIGAEAHFLPLLFLTICLGNIKILPLYYQLSHIMILSPYWIGILYHFAFLFSSFLFLASGLFQQTMNPVRLGQYSLIGGIFSFLLAMLAPMTRNSVTVLNEVSITNSSFMGVALLVSALAVITYSIAIYEERGGRQTVSRGLSFALMIVGNTMLTLNQDVVFNLIALLLYCGGAILLMLITRTYHIWS